ncbi:MAG TPA: PAS domain-containing protein [Gaiellaceae bacterium]|nr:PAS domain-containing protein [Gaiellaceae bacterium]
MPHFICPNCKERSVHVDAEEGFFDEAAGCHHCGFGFLFELMDDYYPAPGTGLVTCDQEGRILALGRGVFELSGYNEQDVLGNHVVDAFGLQGFEEEKNPVKLALEWGVRRLNERLQLRTHGGQVKAVVGDFFPALDEDGGLLVALTPAQS